MSVYEKRWQVCAGFGNSYFDDARDVVRIVETYAGDVSIHEGYADYEEVGPGHPQYGGIEGTIVTRRTLRSNVPLHEVHRIAARIQLREDLTALLLSAIGGTADELTHEQRNRINETVESALPSIDHEEEKP